jgi:hypothetical protein
LCTEQQPKVRSGGKIGECHIIAGENRYNDALVSGCRFTTTFGGRGFDLYILYNKPAARTEQLLFWGNSLRY